MKKALLTFLFLAAVFSLARAQGFRWQGVANDAAGNPVSQAVTLKFSILKNGAAVYVENQNPITPVAGQISATVGGGTAVQGTFVGIDWANGPFSLNVKMKIGSGAELDMGTSQILIPPYVQTNSVSKSQIVGWLPLKGGDEGIFTIGSSPVSQTVWTIATKSFSGNFNDLFANVQSVNGMEREFYIGLFLDIKASNGSGGGGQCSQGDVIDNSYLPQIAVDYISLNYSGNSIQKVQLKLAGNSTPLDCHGSCDFGVTLSNGTTLLFDYNGVFKKKCQNGFCNTLKLRFYFPKLNALGHETQVAIQGGENRMGQMLWLKVPSSIVQFPNSTKLENRLELAMGTDCGTEVTVNDIYLIAVDKTNGSQPAINISSSLGSQVIPNHYLGGYDGKILIAENSNYVSISGKLVSPQITVGTGGIISSGVINANGGITASGIINANGGITASGIINANGGINIPGISIVNGNLGIGTISPTERLDVNGRIKTKVLEITGADIIEKANATETLLPGEVVVWDDSKPNSVKKSTKTYDKQVFGVVSGAKGLPHGVEMTAPGQLDGNTNVAIAGRVYVMVTGDVKPGNLLTTSKVAGRAMKAKSQKKSFGAIIGKALSKPEADGLVLMLVNLQ